MPPFLAPLVDRVGGPRKALIVLVGLATALLIFGVSRWAAAPAWVPAFSNLPLEDVGALAEKLTGAGIEHRLENGGTTIMVSAADLAKARVTLAQAGLPSAGRPGLELFDQPSWGMTDFTQRVNYRRALEGELERTIGKMRGVDAAQVHLALHETQSFRRAAEKPAQASVVLKLKSGESPERDVVRGITHLAASSVDGLASERVTVLDEAGRLLTSPHDAGSIAGLTNRQLEQQREVESYLEQKAQTLVGQLVGGENARVQVSADVNFDRVERTTQTVDPERQALATEQKAEITPGAEGGAGSTNSAVAYENSRSVETVAGAVGNVTRLSVAVLVNDRLVPAADSTLPPTFVARTPAEIARIETLVRGAVGYDSTRGDVVTVVSMPFAEGLAIAPEPAPTVWERAVEFQRPAINVLALLMAFAVALLAIRALRPASAPAAAATPALAGAGATVALPAGAVGALAAAGLAPAAIPAAAAAAPAREPREPRPPSAAMLLRDEIMEGIDQNPDLTVRLVRSWMKEV